MRNRIVFAAILLLALPSVSGAQDGEAQDGAGSADPASGRIYRLSVADVGRLALRNSPAFRATVFDPGIARTRAAEALAAFEPLFAARSAFGRNRTRSFFNPTGGGAGETEQNAITAGASIDKRLTSGTVGSLGYNASSIERRGSVSIGALSPRYDGALSLGVSQPLLRGAGGDVNLSPTREAQANVRRSEHDLERLAEQTVARAETEYWRLVGARADLAVREKSLRVARELLGVAQARLDSGTGILVEVTEARAGVELRKVDVIFAVNVVENQGDALRELVLPFEGQGTDLDLVIVPADRPGRVVAELPTLPTRAVLNEVLVRRTDVRAAGAAVQATEEALVRERNGIRWELNAVGSGSLSGTGSGFSTHADDVVGRRLYAWELGLELKIPLGNAAALARLRRARREKQRAERSLVAVRSRAILELREATRNVRSSAERIVASGKARQAAGEQLAAERSRLENGVTTPFEVLQVEEDLVTAEAAEIQARVDYEVARASLELALGTLLVSRGLTELVLEE